MNFCPAQNSVDHYSTGQFSFSSLFGAGVYASAEYFDRTGNQRSYQLLAVTE